MMIFTVSNQGGNNQPDGGISLTRAYSPRILKSPQSVQNFTFSGGGGDAWVSISHSLYLSCVTCTIVGGGGGDTGPDATPAQKLDPGVLIGTDTLLSI